MAEPATSLYSGTFRNGFFGLAATAVMLFLVIIRFSILNMLISRSAGGDTGGKKA